MVTLPEDVVEMAGEMATLPIIFTRINEAVENPESSFSEMGQIISGDSALSARLLKIVNSAFYGFSNKIETITHAITIIGTAQLRDLVLATAVVEKFQGVPSKTIDMKSFWLHSISCGLAARIIATYRHERNPERFYVLGVLHDIGRLLMFLNIPDQMRQVIEMSEQEKISLHEAEKKVIGFDHAEMGGFLMEAWNLPVTFQTAINFCHDPSSTTPECDTETSIIHVADLISHSMEYGSSGDPYVPPLDERAWKKIGLRPSILASVIYQLDRHLDETIHMLM